MALYKCCIIIIIMWAGTQLALHWDSWWHRHIAVIRTVAKRDY